MSSINVAKEVMKIAQQSQDCVLLEGKHGIGKSAVVQQFADEIGAYMFPLFLSTQESGDLIGIPTEQVIEGKKVTVWSRPSWLQRMHDIAAQGKHCVLFLDELNRAPLDVRQSALQLVLEGKIHEHELPIVDGVKTFVVAAINPADEYQVQELDPALLDRFLCLNVDVNVKDWLQYAREKEVLSVIRDFVAEFPDRLHYTPDEGKGPTPRAWVKLSDLLSVVQKTKAINKATIYDIVQGRLGTEVGAQFYSFFNNYVDVIKAEDIENFIVENDVDNIEELGEIVKKEFGKIEAIRKHEIAAELIKRHIVDKSETSKIAMAYLYSLDVEIVTAILKKMKGEDSDLYMNVAKIDGDLNKKGLFRRIVSLANKSN